MCLCLRAAELSADKGEQRYAAERLAASLMADADPAFARYVAVGAIPHTEYTPYEQNVAANVEQWLVGHCGWPSTDAAHAAYSAVFLAEYDIAYERDR